MIELDAYVDDELPDYIMVMVANDRTQVTLVYVISKNNLHHTNAKKKFLYYPDAIYIQLVLIISDYL